MLASYTPITFCVLIAAAVGTWVAGEAIWARLRLLSVNWNGDEGDKKSGGK